MLGYKSSSNSYLGSNTTRRQNKQGQSAAQTAKEGAGRLSRFGSAMKEKSGDDAVTRIQKYARAENERQRKKKQDEAAAAKNKSTAPTKGFFGRMIDKYVYNKKEG